MLVIVGDEGIWTFCNVKILYILNEIRGGNNDNNDTYS